MATADHKGAPSALEQLINAQRAKLMSAHAVQKCLYEVLLYADGEGAVVYADAAHVVATLMEEIMEKLDPLLVHRMTQETGCAGPAEQTP